MSEQLSSTKPIAVLIDAENVSRPDLMEALLLQLRAHGTVGLKRAYGNAVAIENWKDVAVEYGIQPMLQFNLNKKGNASDFALTIDAMDLLHSCRFGAFCIVSGDSDFVPLVTRLRADGLAVFGCGHANTKVETRKAYDAFFDVDALVKPRSKSKAVKTTAAKLKPKGRKPIPSKLFLSIIKSLAGEDGHSLFAEIEAKIQERRPEFDPTAYGYVSLREMFEESEAFDFVAKRGKHKAYVKLP